MKNKPSNKTCVFTKICLVFTLQNNWVHSCGSQEIAAIGVDYFDKGRALVAVASAKAFLVLSKSSATVRGKWTGISSCSQNEVITFESNYFKVYGAGDSISLFRPASWL